MVRILVKGWHFCRARHGMGCGGEVGCWKVEKVIPIAEMNSTRHFRFKQPQNTRDYNEQMIKVNNRRVFFFLHCLLSQLFSRWCFVSVTSFNPF